MGDRIFNMHLSLYSGTYFQLSYIDFKVNWSVSLKHPLKSQVGFIEIKLDKVCIAEIVNVFDINILSRRVPPLQHSSVHHHTSYLAPAIRALITGLHGIKSLYMNKQVSKQYTDKEGTDIMNWPIISLDFVP